RLPRIGDDPADAPPAPAADAPPIRLQDPDAPAWRRFGRPFEAAGDLPLFAIVLIDGAGEAAMLPFEDVPVTIAVDPARPDAAQTATVWRAAGQEVLALSTVLPPGSGTAEAEVALEALGQALPESIGVMEAPAAGFDRAAANALAPGLAPRGLALLTWDRGLNPADQVARRESVPAARIFRDLDAEGENAATIRRYLDRAAFRAQQEGQVIVAGRMRPETLAAIADWLGSQRAAQVTLAPVSAILAQSAP
ncbi:MAG: divergent polysaccharide deacetylase family protein, partial [Gemmobacter sp.]